jgi:hypothetical protein
MIHLTVSLPPPPPFFRLLRITCLAYGLDEQGVGSVNAKKGRHFSFPQPVQTGFMTHPVYYPVYSMSSFPEGKAAQA